MKDWDGWLRRDPPLPKIKNGEMNACIGAGMIMNGNSIQSENNGRGSESRLNERTFTLDVDRDLLSQLPLIMIMKVVNGWLPGRSTATDVWPL
jgi:hypothetical protein